VNSETLSNDETVSYQFSNLHSGVGEGDFLSLIGVEPNSFSTALQDGSSESFLNFKSYHLKYPLERFIIHARTRARLHKERVRKGRHCGTGKRRGTREARMPTSIMWMRR
jgi:hypothetical protein